MDSWKVAASKIWAAMQTKRDRFCTDNDGDDDDVDGWVYAPAAPYTTT